MPFLQRSLYKATLCPGPGRALSSPSGERERLPAELSQVNLDAAGIDVGASSHFVAVSAARAEPPVQEFAAFTADLYRLADWLAECGVATVVMESTGVYWIPLFGVLEERGFEVMLVDPRRIKNVSGRKTDVLDCQWLQQLHTYGLLSGAFRPKADGNARHQPRLSEAIVAGERDPWKPLARPVLSR